ncbi:hypothetical protein H6A16_02410 [Collinsella tanakaei]|uniref:hypothetical protein n=1 Tax=Collinsella tanakaei TaxID=626935 RepID=UPI00195A2439|nr:hypothetical protein [Collinsella tanakaei]MBM6778349.1 hypothetical protein [Collinsella tanakaei]
MSDDIQPTTHWSNSCMTIIKVLSVVFLLLSLLFLAIAGANFAVLGAIFSDPEWEGTLRAVIFGAVAFALVFALSLLGPWATSMRTELHTMMFTGVAAVVVVTMIIEVASGCFGASSAAFGIGYINGFCLFTGVLAAMSCGLGVSSIMSDRSLAASKAPTTWPSADELVAAVEGEDAAEGADEDAPAAGDAAADDAAESEPADEPLDQDLAENAEPDNADATPDADSTGMLAIDSDMIAEARAGHEPASDAAPLDPLADLDEPELEDEDDDEDDVPFTGKHLRVTK